MAMEEREREVERVTTRLSEGIAGYMRVSTDTQRLQGTIENQRLALDRYAVAQGVTLYGAYEDEGVSGYSIPFGERPHGKRLLADVRAGHVHLVVVTKLDRLGRNAREILNAVHALEEAGGRLISLKENVDTSTSAGRFFLTVLSGVAELERDAIRERTEEGTARRLARCTWMGGTPPIGYRVEGRRKDAHLVLDERVDEASGYSEPDVYRLVWHLCVEVGWSCEDIADRLAALDIPTRARRRGLVVYTRGEERGLPRAAGTWSPKVIYQMLTNPVYKGVHVYHTKAGEEVVGTAPALITEEQWDRAQATLVDHRGTNQGTPYSRNQAYLLRNLMRCGLCGSVLTTAWTRRYAPDPDTGAPGEPWRFYICSRRRHARQYARRRAGRIAAHPDAVDLVAEPQTCHGATLNAAWAEREVWKKAEQYIRHPEEALTLLAARMGTSVDAAEEQRVEVAKLHKALEAFQGERDRILTYYRKGVMTETDLDRQLGAMAKEEASTRAKRDAALVALERAQGERDRMAAARAMLQELHAEMESGPLTVERKRGFLERLVRSITVETHEAGLSFHKRMKYRAEVVVTWAFDDPESAGDDSVQQGHSSPLVRR